VFFFFHSAPSSLSKTHVLVCMIIYGRQHFFSSPAAPTASVLENEWGGSSNSNCNSINNMRASVAVVPVVVVVVVLLLLGAFPP